MHLRLPGWLLPLAFLVLCGPLGIVLALTTPPGQAPDEHAHAIKADSLLLGEWTGHRETLDTADGRRPQQGIDGDPALLSVGYEVVRTPMTAAHLAAIAAVPWGKPTFLALGTISGYWPGFYVAAAAALGAAKAIGASPLQAFLTARIANLIVYMLMGTAALALARRGRTLLFCALALPMSLHLGASVNQDGLVIAASVLAVALLTRPPAAAPSVARRGAARIGAARIGAALLLSAVAMAKPPYLPLAALLLFPLPRLADRPAWAGRAALVALVVAAGVGWTWVTVHFVSTPVLRTPAEAGPLWPGPRPAVFLGADMAGQLSVLMQKPVRFLTLPWEAIRHDQFMLDEAIGVLSYLDLFLPAWLYTAWKVALACAVAADLVTPDETADRLPLWQIPLPLLCAAAALLAVYLSQYLTWTPVGQRHIEGPQGRYWLPLLPVLAFALPSLARFARAPGLPRLAAAGAALSAVPLLVGLADVFALPSAVIAFFYVH